MSDEISLRTEFRERNRVIAQGVLEGLSVSSVAREWALSTSRCHQLVHEVCRRVEPELYRSLRSLDHTRVRIGVLREYSDAFIESMDDDGELTPYSSIRRIRQLPTMTTNALFREGIHTVQDLKECQPETLRRVPVIGREGLRRVQYALHRIELD